MSEVKINVKTTADNAALKATNAELEKTSAIVGKEDLAKKLGLKEVSEDFAKVNKGAVEHITATEKQSEAVKGLADETARYEAALKRMSEPEEERLSILDDTRAQQDAANKSTKEASEDFSKLIPEVEEGTKSFKIFRAQGENVSNILSQLTRDFPAAGIALRAFMSPMGLVLSVGVAAFRVFKAHVDDVNKSLDNLSKFNAQPMSNIWTTQQTAIDDTIQKISAYKTALQHAGDSPDKVHDAFEQRRKEFDAEIEFARKEIEAQGELEAQLIRTNAAKSGASSVAVESQLASARAKTANSLATLDLQKSAGNLDLLKEELQTRRENEPKLRAAANAAIRPDTEASAALKTNQDILDDARGKLDPNKGALVLEKKAADEKLAKERSENAAAIDYQKTVGGMLNPFALPYRLKQKADAEAAQGEADAAEHKINITKGLAGAAEKAQQRLTDARNNAAKILEDASNALIANEAKQAALERAIASQEALQKIADKHLPRINTIQQKTGALKAEENQIQLKRESQPKDEPEFNLRKSGGGDFDPDRSGGNLGSRSENQRDFTPRIEASAQNITNNTEKMGQLVVASLDAIAAAQQRENEKLWREIKRVDSQYKTSRVW